MSRGGRTGADRAFASLSDAHRRELLVALYEKSPRDVSVVLDGADGRDDDELRMLLRHSHLPILEEFGLVDWDREADRVSRGPNFDDIRPLLEFVVDRRDELPDTLERPSRDV